MESRSQMSFLVVALFMAAAALAGCADVAAVERAAAEYVAPQEFVSTESETLNGFEEVQRVFDYSTDVGGVEACELGRRSLEAWAGASPELLDRESPGSFCRYELRSVPNFPEIDFAALSVKRRTDGTNSPDHVSRVVVFFSIDK